VAKSDEKAKGAFRKFIPTSQNVYGVRVPLLNVETNFAAGEVTNTLYKTDNSQANRGKIVANQLSLLLRLFLIISGTR